jgi:TFIIF-interacting CTD phosphatases, including NLI-interacting factor
MDETMIRTYREDQDEETEDFRFLIEGFDEQFRVKLRPGLLEFLEDVSCHYRLAVFTAGKEEYARPILKHIDPQGKFFERMLFQHHCDQTTFAKDITLIEKDLSNVVLLDNNPNAFLQPRNGMSIIDFYGENDLDRELAMVSGFLKSCSNSRYCPDIRDAASQWQKTFYDTHNQRAAEYLEVDTKEPSLEVSEWEEDGGTTCSVEDEDFGTDEDGGSAVEGLDDTDDADGDNEGGDSMDADMEQGDIDDASGAEQQAEELEKIGTDAANEIRDDKDTDKDDTDDAADGDEDTEQAKEQYGYGLVKCKDENGRCCRRSLRNRGIVKKYM